MYCTVCGFEYKLEHMGYFSVCDQPFNSVGSCVRIVDNVLHNFESAPCLTQGFIDIDLWKIGFFY